MIHTTTNCGLLPHTSRSIAADGTHDACMQVDCHNSSANTFVVLVGDSQADFKYYGPPEQYERYVGDAPVLC